jgi:hypothetical protein
VAHLVQPLVAHLLQAALLSLEPLLLLVAFLILLALLPT